MKFLAVYLLLKSGGKANPTKSDIINCLASVGVHINEDDQLLEIFIRQIDKGLNLIDLVANPNTRKSILGPSMSPCGLWEIFSSPYGLADKKQHVTTATLECKHICRETHGRSEFIF